VGVLENFVSAEKEWPPFNHRGAGVRHRVFTEFIYRRKLFCALLLNFLGKAEILSALLNPRLCGP